MEQRQLWPHQETAIEMLRESFAKGLHRPILAGGCGFGKTTVASELIQRAVEKNRRCGFIVDRVELLDQAAERFRQDGIDLGVMQGDHPLTDPRKQVQVATIQTLNRRRLQDFDFIIIDEVHCLHRAHIKYMQTYDAIPVIGLTATPYTKGLGKHFNNLLVPITNSELMEQGYLNKCDIYSCYEPDMDGVSCRGGDYDEDQMDERINKPKLVGDIVKTHQKLAKGRSTVCFAVSIAHSKHIVEQFRNIGVKAVHVDAYTDTDVRKVINRQYNAGEIDLVSCVAIFGKGWDSPIASCLIDARPRKSIMDYVQINGRVWRTFEGKQKSIIIDHAGNFRHGWPEEIVPDHLDMGTKNETEPFKREKKKKEPSECQKCGYVKEGLACPVCGFAPSITRNVESVAGELGKKEKKKTVTREEKVRWYAMLLCHAQARGYKSGWAYHKLVQKFGESVRDTKIIQPMQPDLEVMNWIKHMNIRAAKGRAKYAARG